MANWGNGKTCLSSGNLLILLNTFDRIEPKHKQTTISKL